MTSAVLVAAVAPLENALAESVAELHGRGVDVFLVTYPDPAGLAGGLDDAHVRYLRSDADRRSPAFWRSVFAEPLLSKNVWEYMADDEVSLRWALAADVLVALDYHAVYAVWQLAKLNRTAEARFGVDPALAALDGLHPHAVEPVPTQPEQSRLSVRARARNLAFRIAADPDRAALGLRRSLLRSRRLPASLRAAAGASAVRGMLPERSDAATVLAREVAARLPDTRARADFYGDIVSADLAEGRHPVLLGLACEAELHLSDELRDQGDAEGAATSFMQAARLMFHRAAHLDSVSSPLAERPEEFTAPLRASTIYRDITAERGRLEPPKVADGATTRVLVVHHDNPAFLDEVTESFRQREGVDLEIVDLSALGGAGTWARNPLEVLRSAALGDGRAERLAETHLRPLLDSADVVFVEWCTALAYLVNVIDPGQARIVVRLHSFEAFTVWPQLLDFSRIDTLLFVSDHLRDLTQAAVPRLATSDTKLEVIANGVDLRRYVGDKPAEARHTLALVGFQVVAKDPRWAIDVLRLLRAEDPRYRLVLIGADFAAPLSAAAAVYRDAFERDLAELEPTGAVVRAGRIDDVAGALLDIGVILSTSVRESQHLALLEGAASGAVPVVRDWPFFAGMPHGARTLFPAEWVVARPEEAAERILATTADVEIWRREGARASGDAIARFDVAVKRADFQKLLTT